QAAHQHGVEAWDDDALGGATDAATVERILGEPEEVSGKPAKLDKLAALGWERRLTRRGKGLRAAGTVLGLTLAFVVILATSGVRVSPLLRAVLGDPAVPYAADEVAPTRTFTGAPPTPLPVAHWERLSLPMEPNERLADYQPSRSDPQTIFACVAPSDIDGLGFVRGPVTLWRTQDAGARWTTLALPPLMGSDCSVATASDAPQRLALLVIDSRPHDPGAPCDLYLSGDGGATWTHAPHTVAPAPDA